MVENDTRTYSDARRRLIGQLEKDRAQLLRNIETCRIRDIENPIVGEWSLKDIIGHVVFWENQKTEQLSALREENKIAFEKQTTEEIDELNKMNVLKRRQDVFWEILAELTDGRHKLMLEIGLLDDDQLGADDVIERHLVSAVSLHDRDHWRSIAAYLAGLGSPIEKRTLNTP